MMTCLHNLTNQPSMRRLARNPLRSARLRRLLAALCAGLAVFLGLQCLRSTVETRPAVVTTQHIRRGDTITASVVAVRDIPYDAAWNNAFHTIDDVTGMVAQIDIPDGGIVTATMARASPMIPQGHTAVDVRLASSIDELDVGDEVTLPGAVPAQGDAGDDGGALRELASRAMVIGKPAKDANGMATATFAMSPDEAAAVLQVQEYAAIIAVTR